MAQHHRSESLVDLVEVEVRQGETIAGQQSGDGIGGCHQQTVRSVDIVDRRRLGVNEVRQRVQRMRLRPFLGRQESHRSAVGQRGGVTGRHRRVAALHPEHRLEGGELAWRGVGAQIVVPVQTQEWRHQVVEESAVVGRRHVAVAGGGKFILIGSLDSHLLGGDRRVLPHRQTGARLAIGRNLHTDGRGQRTDELEPFDVRLRTAQRHQRPTEVVAQPDRRVRRGVDTTCRCHLIAAGGDSVGGRDGGLEARPAGLLNVERRRVGRQRTAQHTLAHQVEIPAVLENRAADDHVQPRTVEVETIGEAGQYRGEHVGVRRLGVGAIGTRERDSVAAEDGDPALGL